MLRRLGVSNFRCFDNFSVELPTEGLLVGFNGSGKSTFFDVIRRLQAFLSGNRHLKTLANASDLTAWTSLDTIEFQMDVREGSQNFLYRLTVKIPRTKSSYSPIPELDIRIIEEVLLLDGQPLITRKESNVYMFGSDEPIGIPWPEDQSAISPYPVNGGHPVSAFKTSINKWIIISPNAPFMDAESVGMSPSPNRYATNLVAWYQYLSQNQKWQLELRRLLKSVWPDLDFLQVENSGQRSNILLLHFSGQDPEDIQLVFNQLSDGERMLLLLYMLAAYISVNDGACVFIDEPDNYISFSEIQPWLVQILDVLEEGDQLLMASHHPEIIDTMGEGKSLLMNRTSHSSGSRVERIDSYGDSLSFSEHISKGWFGA